ncbi:MULTISPECIES: hypothetical protein [unclassified Streptosporangium]|uniref:hypothetical protein n=1 Tax=unclassified Streptosporangium TaxID=2632669 RepID=UPI002E2875D7|nr:MULTISPECIES: hypothetical protein [unclassified Streptosporangium]
MTDLLEETGDERADAALGGLTRLGALPVSAHADVFEEVFTGLEQALAAVNGTSGRESGAADDTPGRATVSPDGASGRVIAPAHGVSERETVSPNGVQGQGPASAHGLPGQGSAYGLPGQGHASADGTRDRRP